MIQPSQKFFSSLHIHQHRYPFIDDTGNFLSFINDFQTLPQLTEKLHRFDTSGARAMPVPSAVAKANRTSTFFRWDSGVSTFRPIV